MYAIALDIGGTKIYGCLVRKDMKIIADMKVATEPSLGKRRVLNNISKVVVWLKKRASEDGLKIKGVGVSAAGFGDIAGKVLFGGGSLKCLEGLNLKNEIRKMSGFPVFIENDANCFTLAEALYGAGINKGVVLGVIWGTGIGSGIVINQKIHRGSVGGAGEFGFNIVNPLAKGRKTGNLKPGCLEYIASGKNIQSIYRKNHGIIKDADPSEIYRSSEEIAKEVMNDAIHYLALALSSYVNILNPDIIILGGGVSNLPDPVYKILISEVKEYALPTHTKSLMILRSELSEKANILGAAAIVFKEGAIIL